MSNSYVDKFQQMEASAAQYMEDLNILTNELNAMATYMNQYDLAEIQAAVGSVDVAAFQGIRVDQVSELIVDEQAQKAIQNYIIAVTDLSKDLENGYEAHVNININDLVADLAKKREETYMAMTIDSDPSMLMMIDSYRWAEAVSSEKDDDAYYRLAIANVLHDAMEEQGVQNEITAYNASANMSAMLIGFEHAMRNGAAINEQLMYEQMRNLMTLHVAEAVKNGDDVDRVITDMIVSTEKTVNESNGILTDDYIKAAVVAGHDLAVQLDRVDSVEKTIMGTDAEKAQAYLQEVLAEKSSEHANEHDIVREHDDGFDF